VGIVNFHPRQYKPLNRWTKKFGTVDYVAGTRQQMLIVKTVTSPNLCNVTAEDVARPVTDESAVTTTNGAVFYYYLLQLMIYHCVQLNSVLLHLA